MCKDVAFERYEWLLQRRNRHFRSGDLTSCDFHPPFIFNRGVRYLTAIFSAVKVCLLKRVNPDSCWGHLTGNISFRLHLQNKHFCFSFICFQIVWGLVATSQYHCKHKKKKKKNPTLSLCVTFPKYRPVCLMFSGPDNFFNETCLISDYLLFLLLLKQPLKTTVATWDYWN